LLFSHRGGAKLVPENTLEAFRSSVDLWDADVLEMDVHRTRDGELVVIHDPTVDRTTDGFGPVAEMSWRKLSRLDAGYRFLDPAGRPSFRDRGIHIPRFIDVLRALPDTRMNVDSKDPEVASELIALLRSEGQTHRVLLASEGEEGRADRLGYEGPVSATKRQLKLFVASHRLPWGGPYTPPVDALQIPYVWEGRQITTPRLIREAHRRNLAVHVWVVDEPEVMRELIVWGADAVQTDRPDLLARVLHEEVGRPLPPGLRTGGAPTPGGS
jgi:glycerophosphoryl diester phosphodiesterase